MMRIIGHPNFMDTKYKVEELLMVLREIYLINPHVKNREVKKESTFNFASHLKKQQGFRSNS